MLKKRVLPALLSLCLLAGAAVPAWAEEAAPPEAALNAELPEKTPEASPEPLEPLESPELPELPESPEDPARASPAAEEAVRYPVTVAGSFAADSGEGAYEAWALVTLRAGEREGYVFDGWTLSENVLLTYPGQESQPEITFSMPESAVTAEARWLEATGGGSCGDTLSWTLDAAGVLTVSGTGEMTSAPWLKAAVKSLVLEEGVTSIAASAFDGCAGLSGSLTLPASAVSIGEAAFRDCRGLSGELVLPAGLTGLGDRAFENCSGFTGSLTIPEGAGQVGYSAFSGCSGFDGALTLPDGVQIGSYAFSGCSGFTGTLSLPKTDSLGYPLGDSAFSGCRGFTGLVIPEGARFLGNGTFSGCSGLTGTLRIPSGVYAVGSYTFSGCSGLTGLDLPAGLERIDGYAFSGCSGLTGELVLPDGVTDIGRSAFQDCTGLTGELVLPAALKELLWSAFQGCTGLTGVSIPENVTVLQEQVFRDCTGLTGVLTIPGNVTHIYNGAFYGCTGLTGLNLSEGLLYISSDQYKSGAFAGCTGLAGELVLPESLRLIGRRAFQNCAGLTGVLTVPGSVEVIEEYAFCGCTGLQGLDLSDGLTAIRESAFEDCSGLTGLLSVPGTVQSIGDIAFRGCSGLTGAVFAQGVESIGAGAFDGCLLLSQLTLPEGLQSLGANAFSGCARLSGAVALPASLASIGHNPFAGCPFLTAINAGSAACVSVDGVLFSGDMTRLIACPAGRTETFCAIPEGVTAVDVAAFWGCGDLLSLGVPRSLVSVEDSAFHQCIRLKTVLYAGGEEDWAGVGIRSYNNEPLLNAAVQYNWDGTPPVSVYPVTVTGSRAAGSGAGNYEAGASVTLHAGERPGYDFDGWAVSGIVLTDPSAPDATFIMPARSVTAEAHWRLKTGPAASGTCGKNGDNLTWTLDRYGTLTVSGTGEMADYFVDGYLPYDELPEPPWSSCVRAVLEEGVASVGAGAFRNCAGLTSVSFPDSLRAVGEFAFENCSGLSGALVLPAGAVSVGQSAFRFCAGLTSADLPEGLTVIAPLCFDNCSGLARVSIPKSTAHVNAGAFDHCSGLNAVYYDGSLEDWRNIQVAVWNEPLQEAELFYPAAVEGSRAEDSGAGRYPAGKSVTLRAGERPGYIFAGWSLTGVTLENPAAPEITFPMPAGPVAAEARWREGGETSLPEISAGEVIRTESSTAVRLTLPAGASLPEGLSVLSVTFSGGQLTGAAAGTYEAAGGQAVFDRRLPPGAKLFFLDPDTFIPLAKPMILQ